MATQDDYRRWLERGLGKPGMRRVRLAEDLGVSPSAVTRMIKGERRIALEEVPVIARFIGEQPPASPGAHLPSEDILPTDDDEDEKTGIPVVGYVQAGAQASYRPHHESVLDRVTPPHNATTHTVAFEIRGDSLGELFDRWLVFFDDVRRPVTNDLIGKLCVVGLSDGRIMVKKLARGRKGLYTLLSDQMRHAPIENVAIDWAARVKTMVPR